MKRIGVVGYGMRIRLMLETIARFGTDVTLVAVVDPAETSLRERFPEELAGVDFYSDVDSMLDVANLDGVMIGTSCVFHTPYAVKVLERHLPLFLEKPVAIDEEQLAELHNAALTSHSPTVVSFPLRLSKLCLLVKDIVQSGTVGAIEHVQAINNVPFYGSNYFHGWMRDDSLTGGLWLQKATHDLDYLTFLLGKLPARIVAVESKTVFTGEMPSGLYCLDCSLRETCPESQYNLFAMQGMLDDMRNAKDFWDGRWQCSFAVDTGNHDAATAILQYEDGSHLSYSQVFYTRRQAARRGATLTGYRGTISFDWYSGEIVVTYHHTARVDRITVDAGSGHFGGDEALAQDFLAILYGSGRSRSAIQDGVLSAQLCLMAKQSCQTNAFVAYQPL